MVSARRGVGRVSQPVLPLVPAQARSIGASVGLLEGPDGGVVFVFGLATFSYAAADEIGRRLAAVQLVTSKIATSVEVASAFGVSGVTLWTWRRDYTAGGVAGPGPDRTEGPEQADRRRDPTDRRARRGGVVVAPDRRTDRGLDRDGAGRVGSARDTDRQGHGDSWQRPG